MPAANRRLAAVLSSDASPGTACLATKISHSQVFVSSSLLAALGALLALQGMAWVFCLALALVFFLIALMLGLGRAGAAAWTISFVLFFFLAQDRLGRLSPTSLDLCQLRANVVSFSGRVESSKIKDTEQGRVITAVVSPLRLILPWSKMLGGRVLLHMGPFTKAAPVVPVWGGQYIFTGRLIKPRARVFSFEFDERRWLALQNIYCQVNCSAGDIQDLCRSSGRPEEKSLQQSLFSQLEEVAGRVVQAVVNLREGIVAGHMRALGDERGKLLTSMVLGDRAVSLSDGIKTDFNRVGLSHLLAASGLNLTIIVGACVLLFNLSRRGKQEAPAGLMQTIGALACVLFFVSLAGASPSVTRATIMCLLLLWSSLMFRRLARGAALAGALWLALLFDPLSILDVGLELSYGATFGIIYFYPLMIEALPRGLAKKPWHWLCAICAVVLSAQLAVMPVQIYYFQKISTLVLPANALAEPLVAPITVIGFLSSLISALAIGCGWAAADASGAFCHLSLVAQALGQISAFIDFLCGYLLDLLLCLTRSLGAFPFSYLYLARTPAAAVVFYYLALIVAFILGHNRPARGAGLALISGLVLTMHSFLLSSSLEVMVSGEKVLIGRAIDPPLLLTLADADGHALAGKHGSEAKGYLPAFHRDFIQTYLHSLNQQSCTAGLLKPQQLWQVIISKSGLVVLGREAEIDSRAIVWLSFQDGEPKIESLLPEGSIEVESAQGVRLFKFKMWGLGWLLAHRVLSSCLALPLPVVRAL